ncbi:hypothetical protein [Actinomadura decatromicini]|uniref:Uncharacterized protein n=1 Tax=Actinomadura decatromicini TaxID=2604572 RepID=A0A5D3FGT2_9ACTN|nr:hypothetical protein [Actinomadura decatromicini]TYK47182.1 hypothetical protein FXF68_25625 [Actinomadura decatromicini]
MADATLAPPALDAPGGPAHQIHAAVRAIEQRHPYTAEDDALATLLAGLAARHRHIPATPALVAMCTCGDEWLCPDLSAAMTLSAAILEGDERDGLAEQARRVWMAAAELHQFNSPEGEHLDGCPGCRIDAALDTTRPDPRARALDLLAARYPEAFEDLLQVEQARAAKAGEATRDA